MVDSREYVLRRILRVLCREAGWQLYRLLSRLVGRRRG
jgi:hypothetical protein